MKEVVEGGRCVKGSNMDFTHIDAYIDAKLYCCTTDLHKFPEGLMSVL